jgi:hypothetical protein
MTHPAVESDAIDEVLKRVIVVTDSPDEAARVDLLFDLLDRKINGNEAVRTVRGPYADAVMAGALVVKL